MLFHLSGLAVFRCFNLHWNDAQIASNCKSLWILVILCYAKCVCFWSSVFLHFQLRLIPAISTQPTTATYFSYFRYELSVVFQINSYIISDALKMVIPQLSVCVCIFLAIVVFYSSDRNIFLTANLCELSLYAIQALNYIDEYLQKNELKWEKDV